MCVEWYAVQVKEYAVQRRNKDARESEGAMRIADVGGIQLRITERISSSARSPRGSTKKVSLNKREHKP